ncbi:GIN domain-containing protein [Halioxenophilus sp. WMMB6]|uniref:GIN domain-containing protein n=1 Tax=Halioxenophilus sp. WMMB6 TaxID=3073815 RepID=UPI00295E5C28|nr:DUF2807 domain-containing protein [Halioxenophilus sp. WMMB6]
MHRNHALPLLFALGLLLLAVLARPVLAGSELYTKAFTLTGVTELEVNHGFRVVVSQGSAEFVRAIGSRDALAHIVATVEEGRLQLGADTEDPLPVTFEVQLNTLERLALNGVLFAELGPFAGERLRLQMHGTGELAISELAVRALEVSLDGSGSVNSGKIIADQVQLKLSGTGLFAVEELEAKALVLGISGSAGVHIAASSHIDTSDIQLAGSGNFSAANTITRQAEVAIAGSANALLHVTEWLDVNTAGSGTVTYYGNPSINAGIFGTGWVRRALPF